MAEYIKRYDAMKICQEYSTHCFSVSDARGQDVADRIEDEIAEIPTADVVEVVRCKDCKNYTTWELGSSKWESTHLHCIHFRRKTTPSDFCSYGERK